MYFIRSKNLLQLIYGRKSKNSFVKMSKKLTFFYQAKKILRCQKKQETLTTI